MDAFVLGKKNYKEKRKRSIENFFVLRLEAGMTDEIERLLSSGVKGDDLIYYGLEYKFVTQYVLGLLTAAEMRYQLEIAIHQFAKRQMTWFRGMERRGFKINWLPFDLPSGEFVARVEEIYKSNRP